MKSRGKIDDGYNAFINLMESGRMADGIMAHNDLCAVGIIMAARKQGLRLPEDLAVIGFDNVSRLNSVMPDLTSISQPCERLAEEAFKTLELVFSAPDRMNFSSRSVVATQLFIRSSTTGFLPRRPTVMDN